MGTSVAYLRVTAQPVAISANLAGRLQTAFCHVYEEFGEVYVPADREISPVLRQALEGRRDSIRSWLQPGGPAAIIDDLGMIFTTMGMRSGSANDVKTVAKIYAIDLADLPTWAVSQSCRDFRQGRAGDAKWAPTQAEIRLHALSLLRNVEDELGRINRVLLAKPVREDEKRKGDIKALVTETLHELRAAKTPVGVVRGGMSPEELRRAREISEAIQETDHAVGE